MKTSYFLVVLLALTLLPEDVDGWFFRSVRRIRVNVYHKLGCMAACRWARSWACKVCKRKRGLDVHPHDDADDDLDAGVGNRIKIKSYWNDKQILQMLFLMCSLLKPE